jgi:outer membrane protein
MKNAIKVALFALMVFVGSQAANAQKLGFLNSEEVFGLMPERDSARVKMETYGQEQYDILELMEVEYRNKQEELTKNLSTWSATQTQVAQETLQSLITRIQEREAQVQQDLQAKNSELMAPLVEKFNEAVKKAAQAAGIAAVFDVNTMSYYSPEDMTDMTPLVKKELGIQ